MLVLNRNVILEGIVEGRALDCSNSMEMYGIGMRDNKAKIRPQGWFERDKNYPILVG